MHNRRPPPDFVIAGAAKCGTTALYQYFQDHPQVFMTTPKEPHYFADDLINPHYITDKSKYLQLFATAPDDVLRGEASVHYINSKNAIGRLLQHNPKIKVFILLRNPIELVRSWHSMLLYNGEENIKNIEAAWRAQESRAQGHRIPPHMSGREIKLQYRSMCAVGQQTLRIVEQVPAGQLQILLLDDLVENRELYYAQACKFLNVEYHPPASDVIVNPSKRNRWPWLGKFLKWSEFFNHPRIRGLAPYFDHIGFHPLRMLRVANTVPSAHKEIEKEFRQELYESFKDEIDMLETLLGRSLDRWREQ